MAKKKNNEPAAPVKKSPGPALTLHSIYLKIGAWKELFTGQQYKIIIAEALNYCACNEGLHVAGYLITDMNVCLVWEIDQADIKRMLDLFYQSVRKEVHKHKERAEILDLRTYDSKDITEAERFLIHLFEEYALPDDQLVKLITGREVDLPYYSPRLARLKDRLHHYDFCSALDYSGGRGPVIVKLIDYQEGFHQERTNHSSPQ